MLLPPSAVGSEPIDRKSNSFGLSVHKDGKSMEISNQKRDDNYQEYLLLKRNPAYSIVTLNPKSGGVCAVHKEHCFDKQIGPYGCRRGQYELTVAIVLSGEGHCILLESEYPKGKNIKVYDAIIDGIPAEIKTVESNGRWAIRTKIHAAIRQGASLLVLYFPSKLNYSEERIIEGWSYNKKTNQAITLNRILAVVEGEVLEILKPPG